MKSKDQTTYIKLSIVSHGEKANQKNQISKNFPWTQSLCTKRVFSWLSKTSQGPNYFKLKGYFLDCSPAWLISVFQSQTGNTHLLAEKCAFAKILLQLFSCLCQPYCSWIYYQPFKNHSRYCVRRTYMNGAISNINWLFLKVEFVSTSSTFKSQV